MPISDAVRVDKRIAVAYPWLVPKPIYHAPPAGSGKLRGPTHKLITQNDYPSAAIRLKQEGVVRVVLRVGRDGQANDCAVKTSSGSSILDERTCALLVRRGRWNPKQDGYGNITEFDYLYEFNWRLPQ
jgi:protein TonB